MNILFIKYFFVGFMVSEIPRVSVYGHCRYTVTFPTYLYNLIRLVYLNGYIIIIKEIASHYSNVGE